MTTQHIALGGHSVASLTLRVPSIGAWVADAIMVEAPELAGTQQLTIGASTLVGTVVDSQSMTFAGHRGVRLVGGAGGWGKALPARDYHNDAGIKAKSVAEDVAREAGETLGSFLPGVERIGIDFIRKAGPASVALEYAAGAGVAWYVDFAGVTHVGARPARAFDPSGYELTAFEPVGRVATLSVDDLTALGIGSTIVDKRLSAPVVVRDIELTITPDGIRATVWCAGADGTASRLAAIMRSVVQRSSPSNLYGLYRYRVIAMAGERVELQAVRQAAGVPDLKPTSVWPGVAGVHAELAPSAEVLVAFIDGDPTQPIVTHFAGLGGEGFTPVRLTLGGPEGMPAARQGDAVEVALPPAQFAGTLNGAPVAGMMTWVLPKAAGVITGGSGKVRVAT